MTLENHRGSGRKQRCLPASCCKVIVPSFRESGASNNQWAQTSSGLCRLASLSETGHRRDAETEPEKDPFDAISVSSSPSSPSLQRKHWLDGGVEKRNASGPLPHSILYSRKRILTLWSWLSPCDKNVILRLSNPRAFCLDTIRAHHLVTIFGYCDYFTLFPR